MDKEEQIFVTMPDLKAELAEKKPGWAGGLAYSSCSARFCGCYVNGLDLLDVNWRSLVVMFHAALDWQTIDYCKPSLFKKLNGWRSH